MQLAGKGFPLISKPNPCGKGKGGLRAALFIVYRSLSMPLSPAPYRGVGIWGTGTPGISSFR